MGKCKNCAAPLPIHSMICGYCGVKNALDLRGIHHNTEHVPDNNRTCPNCRTMLDTINVGENDETFYIERCNQCHGLFFDPGELEYLLQNQVSNVFHVNHGLMNQLNREAFNGLQRNSYKPCPICQQLMPFINFGRKSGVIVDRCKDHGVWLDAGELRRLFEWTKAGGMKYDEAVMEEKLRNAPPEVPTTIHEPPRKIGNEYINASIHFGSRREDTLLDFLANAVVSFLK